MSREIKFRAWDTNDERMIGWRELLDYGSGLADYLEHPRELIFEEFTGLKDKNGVDIYEGDRVTHPLCVLEPHDIHIPCEHFVGIIRYEADRGQYFAVNNQRNGHVMGMGQAYKFEVIGHIWENSELAEV